MKIKVHLRKYWLLYLTWALGFSWLILNYFPYGKPYRIDAEVVRYSSIPGAGGGSMQMLVKLETGGIVMVSFDNSFKVGDSIPIEVIPKFIVSDAYRIAY